MTEHVHVSHTPVAFAPKIPDHIDAKGVVEAVRGVMHETDKGFLPIKDIDLQKPYDLLTTHLQEQQDRLNNSRVDPDNVIDKLETENKELEQKHENDFEQRILDRDNDYRARSEELEKHLAEVSRLKDAEIGIWQERVKELKGKNQDLKEKFETERDLRLNELQRFHDQRIADLERYHANELALTERYAQRLEEKLQTDEERIREDEKTLREDRNKIFEKAVETISDLKLTEHFK